MKKYILVITAVISLPFFSQEEKELVLPELGDRVSGAVSTAEEKLIGREFLKQVYFQAPLISDSFNTGIHRTSNIQTIRI
jgi:DNA-binding protein